MFAPPSYSHVVSESKFKTPCVAAFHLSVCCCQGTVTMHAFQQDVTDLLQTQIWYQLCFRFVTFCTTAFDRAAMPLQRWDSDDSSEGEVAGGLQRYSASSEQLDLILLL